MDGGTPSSTNVHAIVKAQIVFLLSTLTEENFEQNQLQIRTVSFPRLLPRLSLFYRAVWVRSYVWAFSFVAPFHCALSKASTFI